ncbi:MAG: cytochrome C, partial [Candidatus Thiodiazotropha sp. (ex Lucinoma borealis)]|nr:cytochrome C [Candidatus Thiodiazotropha sp. (ex Lucinoma borealis)]
MNSLQSIILFVLLVVLGSAGLAGWDEAKLEREEAMLLPPDYEHGKKVYEICAICHMPEGWGTPN